jgi:hypothetical protein
LCRCSKFLPKAFCVLLEANYCYSTFWRRKSIGE